MCCSDNTTGMNHLIITLNIADVRKIPKLFCDFTCASENKLFLKRCNVIKPLDQSLERPINSLSCIKKCPVL